MLKYVTQNEYKELLGTNSIPDNFENLNIEASAVINQKTFGRINIANIPEQVKYCTCLVINLIDNKKKVISETGNIKSQSIEGWSETYSTPEEIEKDFNSQVDSILKLHLSNILGTDGNPLLYRGIPVYE
jgi:hypothetical protein